MSVQNVVILIALSAGLAAAADTDSWCALEVSITGPEGNPAYKTFARLLGPEGQIVESGMVGSVWRVCDFGFGEHTLEVGLNECFPVVIRSVVNVPKRPQKLRVMLNHCSGDIQRNYCEVYMRVRDPRGQPVANATAVTDKGTSHRQSDRFGRIVMAVPTGATVQINVSAPGFDDQSHHITCKRVESIQKVTTLIPRG